MRFAPITAKRSSPFYSKIDDLDRILIVMEDVDFINPVPASRSNCLYLYRLPLQAETMNALLKASFNRRSGLGSTFARTHVCGQHSEE